MMRDVNDGEAAAAATNPFLMSAELPRSVPPPPATSPGSPVFAAAPAASASPTFTPVSLAAPITSPRAGASNVPPPSPVVASVTPAAAASSAGAALFSGGMRSDGKAPESFLQLFSKG